MHPESDERRTSRQRASRERWEASYQDGPAPWDIGRPQPAVVRLAERGAFAGAVLDAGCGTGENTFHVARHGFTVLGIDAAQTAVAMARAKAAERGLAAEFAVADALAADELGRRFRTVLDCGLFHTLDAQERRRYARGLAAVTEAGGAVLLLCCSDEGADLGPHPVTKAEIAAAFSGAGGWHVTSIEPEHLESRVHGYTMPAHLATIRRLS